MIRSEVVDFPTHRHGRRRIGCLLVTESPGASRQSGDSVERLWAGEHEQVAFCQDRSSGLRAIIALHSTALGPGLGGTRFQPYPNTAAALADAMALSEAMTYKNALAGLDHGGGKGVIIGDPRTGKTEALLRAYGRFVCSLAGRYVTACDVGTYVEDMDAVARECRWVTGRSEARGGAGDSSVLTAVGVFQGMRAAAQTRWGEPSLAGRSVGISGVGKVGRHLVPLLLDDGAHVVVTDIDPGAVNRLLDETSCARAAIDVAESTGALLTRDLDVFSPCALGGAITPEVAATIRAGVICGGANNQLTSDDLAEVLAGRDVLFCPDYCVNAGGVIQVADELGRPFDMARARARAEQIFDTTSAVLRSATAESITPLEAAARIARRRIADVGGLNRILVPRP
jgi:valine dehydrogenase (NAD+)